jgi:ribonuclease HI
MEKIEVFISGSCHYTSATRPGAYGVVIVHNNDIFYQNAEGHLDVTHAMMDIMGVIHALHHLPSHTSIIEVYLSNSYVVDTINKGWLERWKKSDFKGKEHRDLWKVIDSLITNSQCKVIFKHCEKSVNPQYNSLAKSLAKKSVHTLKNK